MAFLATRQEIHLVRERVIRVRKQNVVSRWGAIPASIDYLDREIERASTEDKKLVLYALMYSECARFGLHDLEIHYRRQEQQDLPENPMALAGFAAALMFDEHTQCEAVSLARKAVAAAMKRGTWIRYCLTCLARAAIAASENDALEEALKGLVEDGGRWRAEDYHLEFDFLDRIKPGQIDSDLLDKYQALARGASSEAP